MQNKKVYLGKEGRERVVKGVNVVANAVRSTMGVNGRTVIIGQHAPVPHITKDGVSVAKQIQLSDPAENEGAKLAISTSQQTVDEVGDGTTTTAVLLQALVNEGVKALDERANATLVKKGMDLSAKLISEELQENAIKLTTKDEQLAQIASISANNDTETGEIIANAFKIVGVDGVIQVETSNTNETKVDEVDGLQFDNGYNSPYFKTNQKQEAILEDVLILVTTKVISQIKELVPVLEKVIDAENQGKNPKSLLIFANQVTDEALASLVQNKIQNGLKVAVVHNLPSYLSGSELAEDVAISCGATLIADENGMNLEIDGAASLGYAKKVVIEGRKKTTIIQPKGHKDKIQDRIGSLLERVENLGHKNPQETNNLEKRIANLQGKVAIMYVGANSEVEMKEKKDRIDDAIHATRAALQEGFVPGGGVALLNTQNVLDLLIQRYDNKDIRIGVEIVRKSLQYPCFQILKNAGLHNQEKREWFGFGDTEAQSILKKIKQNGYGYNVETESFCDMVKSGIIDPVKVPRIALEKAVATAGTLLTSECVIVEEVKKK